MSLYVGSEINNLSRKCPICDGGVAKKMCHISYILPKGSPLPEQYDVVCCINCGFIYANVDADQNVYNDYYANYNMYAEDAELKKYVNIQEGEGRRFQEKQLMLKLIKEVLPYDAAILDVGCGGGEILDILKKEGYKNICGMDPSAASIEKLYKKGIEGFVGNIFDAALPTHAAKYDLVISTAVIEHIYDLHGYLRSINTYLKDENSYIMLDAPAIEKIDQCIWPLVNHFNHEHINYFSKTSLNNLLRTEGFTTIADTSYFEVNNEMGIVGLYTKTDCQKPYDLEHDSLTQEAVKNYLLQYEDTGIKDKINDLLELNHNIVIWGVGSFTMQLLSNYPDLLDRVKYFVDNNSTKYGEMICDREVVSPKKLTDEKNIAILICSIKNVDDIRKQIINMGWEKENKVISFENC